MIKLLDSKDHAKTARLDENENPVKVVADHLKLISTTHEHGRAVIATFIRCDPTGAELQPFTQFRIEKDHYEYLLTPKPHETGRKHGNFRPEDIEECIAHFGDFPGANFKGKIELV